MKKSLEPLNLAQCLSKGIRHSVWVLLLLTRFSPVNADPLELLALDFTALPGDSLQIQLTLSGQAFSPRVFHTDNPARIALDLPGVSNKLGKKLFPVNTGGVQSLQAIAVADRTRVVVNLLKSVPFNTRVEGNSIFVTMQKGRTWSTAEPTRQLLTAAHPTVRPVSDAYPLGQSIVNLDFRRGEKGEGRILVTLASPTMIADTREEGRKVVAYFPSASLPANLARRLDVMDFATPVQYIDATEDSNGAKLTITPSTEDFEYSSYQSENLLTIEFRHLTTVEKEEAKKKTFAYGGQKLSLNFQDIPVRSVLQILADFTKEQYPPNGLNIVASDTVGGNVTLRLNDVPWDQALALVLKSKNLGQRQEGSIIQILPLDELNKQIKEELEQQKVVEELEPLKTEIIQINYTNAEDIKKVLVGTMAKTNVVTGQAGVMTAPTATSTTSLDVSQSILSTRGNVTVDARTNQIIVKDTTKNLEKIRDLIKQLDIPIRQVLIEARVVIATNSFARELGSRFSVNPAASSGNVATNYGTVPVPNTVTPMVPTTTTNGVTSSNALFATGSALADLGATGVTGMTPAVLGVTVLKVGDYLLNLELSAAQSEGRSETISNPRIMTADQHPAVINQGTQIPVTSGSTATTVASVTYKDVVLQLDVTPHITPNDNIRMELKIKKDIPLAPDQSGNRAIDTRRIETTVQVSNGDTVVLGGVYENDKTNTVNKVPFFGDLPGIGFLFRYNYVNDSKNELLIFITPKVIKQNLGQR